MLSSRVVISRVLLGPPEGTGADRVAPGVVDDHQDAAVAQGFT
jgi:hypothetical protein